MKNKLIIIACILSTGLFGQGVYNNGGRIIIGNGAYFNINGSGGNYRNETNVSNGSIDLSGTLKLDGNYINNVAAADILSTVGSSSTVAFTGANYQNMGGTTAVPFVFNNLTINNSKSIVMQKNATVNGTIYFTNGWLKIGTNNLNLGLNAIIAGTPSALSMIVATEAGQVRKQFNSPGSFTFPVGDTTGTAEYSPVLLNFASGTFGAGAYAGVNLVNGAYPDPQVTGSYISRYWNITQSAISSFSCNATFQYVPADVTGTEANITTAMIFPSPAVFYNPADIVLHQLTASGLTSFGTFTGILKSKTLNLTLFLEGLYAGASTMNPAWDALGPHWGASIADHITVELHNATTYATLMYSAADVPLNTNGTCSVSIPANFNNNYYITIKNRNSIETVSSAPVSFAPSIISYNFSDAVTKAFGNNLKSIGGVYTIYTGDVTSAGVAYPTAPVTDGLVDLEDLYYMNASYLNGDFGYLNSDLNGDGVVDINDLYLAFNNFLLGVFASTP